MKNVGDGYVEILDSMLVVFPSIAVIAYLNQRTIRTLLSQRGRANRRNNQRLSMAFTAICVACVVLVLPYHLARVLWFLVKPHLQGAFDKLEYFQAVYLVENVIDCLRMLSLSFGFVNSFLLFVLIRNFREPIRKLFEGMSTWMDKKTKRVSFIGKK